VTKSEAERALELLNVFSGALSELREQMDDAMLDVRKRDALDEGRDGIPEVLGRWSAHAKMRLMLLALTRDVLDLLADAASKDTEAKK